MEKTYSSEIKKLGKKIKKLRESKGMTQEALSGECDIDIRTIQRIEKGEYGFGMPILFALAEAFEISPSELVRI